MGRMPPLLIPQWLREQDSGGGSGDSTPFYPTIGAQSEPPLCLLFQAAFAHRLPPPAPDTQY